MSRAGEGDETEGGVTYSGENWTLHQGDSLAVLSSLESGSVNCCVTSPPYWGLRDYGVDGQLGLEPTPQEYAEKMVAVFRDVRRVLAKDGTLWLNVGDSYCASPKGNPGVRGNINGGKRDDREADAGATFDKSKTPGLKPKDLVGIPWMLAFALRADGWYLRQEIIWHKPNPMPESVTDRCTKAHEQVFLLSKSARYYFNQGAILEPVSPNTNMRLSQNLAAQIGSHRANGGAKSNGPMKAVGRKASQGLQGREKSNVSFEQACCLPVSERNKRSVWTITTQGYPDAHFATFPPDLVKPCILAGCPAGGVVLDPFAGSGTTLQVAVELNCRAVGIELNPDYCELIRKRMAKVTPPLAFTEPEPFPEPTPEPDQRELWH